MGYVRTAGMSTAARRARRRAALVMTALFTSMLLVFGLAVAVWQGWVELPGGGTADTAARSSTPEAPQLAASDVTVNVYNSTPTAGLAGRAGDALRARGFKVDAVSNAEEQVGGVGEIRHGPTGAAAAAVLKKALPKGLKLVADERESAEVDLVLGEKWKDLPTADDAASSSEDR